MAWFRLHEGTYSDAKWPAIARRSKVNVCTVVGIWVAVLDHASRNADRGSVKGFDFEIIDALYGLKDGVCQRVFEAMTEKGLVKNERIVNWEKRQPNKEDEGAAERKRKQRERERENRDNVQGHADVTQMSQPVTQGHAPDTDTDKIKNINIKNPSYPPKGGCGGEKPSQSSAKRKTGNSLPELQAQMRDYTDNPALLKTLEDFRLMRERNRKPMTGRALEILFGKLSELAADDTAKIAVLEQSILNSWQGVFPLRTAQPARASPFFRNGDMPATPTEFQKNMQDQRRMSAMLLQMRARKKEAQNGTIAIDGNAVAESDGGQSRLPGGTVT